jgi:hypothetical protein
MIYKIYKNVGFFFEGAWHTPNIAPSMLHNVFSVLQPDIPQSPLSREHPYPTWGHTGHFCMLSPCYQY